MGMPSSMGRLGTGAVGGGQDMARPMTAVRGAGYTSAGNRGQSSVILMCFFALAQVMNLMSTVFMVCLEFFNTGI
jgi:hypothetical protein